MHSCPKGKPGVRGRGGPQEWEEVKKLRFENVALREKLLGTNYFADEILFLQQENQLLKSWIVIQKAFQDYVDYINGN